MQSRLLLDVIITQSTSILKLLSCENQTLLIRGNSLLVLNLCLDIINGIRWLDIHGNGLSGKCLDKNLHTSTKTQYQMQSRLLLDVIITQSTSILKLLSCENQTLLIRGNSLLVLNLCLDIINGIRWLDIQGNGLSSKCLDKNLHTSTKTQYQMQSRLLLDVIITQ